ncbi:MAG: ATP phosphoribosyltransferase regulatory subunit [Selenomonadaceae bacterium]|nr:ATP phosphoribosyltransferase regulatory subunit [Selenomonadaceae bacterium]
MKQKSTILEIPYGTRDFLPEEAAAKRCVEHRLSKLFAGWGYEEVVTPTLEYLDTLTMDSVRSLESRMFKLFDRDNRTLALRHEMTTPIARLAASRLREHAMPMKLSYISSVFRYEQTQTGRQCEFYQAGVELMGEGVAAADAEVIALAVEGLRSSGLKNFSVGLGQVDFANGVMEQNQLNADQREALKSAMEHHDIVGLEALVDSIGLQQQAADTLKAIPKLHGGKDVLERAYSMALSEQSRRALDNLSEIYRLLESYGVADYVTFDLGIIRDFSYYTGMVFEIYTPGLGFPLCGGGRYDHMLSDFGMACPATGFALGIERILLALKRQQLKQPMQPRDIYVGYAPGKADEAVRTAMTLRKEGKSVELALCPQTEADAKKLQDIKGYRELRYIS